MFGLVMDLMGWSSSLLRGVPTRPAAADRGGIAVLIAPRRSSCATLSACSGVRSVVL